METNDTKWINMHTCVEDKHVDQIQKGLSPLIKVNNDNSNALSDNKTKHERKMMKFFQKL